MEIKGWVTSKCLQQAADLVGRVIDMQFEISGNVWGCEVGVCDWIK